MSRATEAIPAPGHEAFAIHPSLLSGFARNSSGSFVDIHGNPQSIVA
jgi:hypothetical protein